MLHRSVTAVGVKTLFMLTLANFTNGQGSTLRAQPIFLAHTENRLCGIRVLFPWRMRCQVASYNIVGSHFNHRLTVVNRIKRAAHIKNWFKLVVSSKLFGRSKTPRVYFPRGRGKLALLVGYQGRASWWEIVNHPLHQFILNRYSSSFNLRQRRAFVPPKTITNWYRNSFTPFHCLM